MPRVIKRKYTEREREYLTYIAEHVDNVQLIWIQVKNLLDGKLGMEHNDEFRLFSVIASLIIKHDDTKYTLCEFDAYRNYFFPDNGKRGELAKTMFDAALEHHYKQNPHHWQFWLVKSKEKDEPTTMTPMTLEYIIEMLCDWSAMSLKFGDSPDEYYKREKDKMELHPSTRNKVEELLPYFVMAVEMERLK